MERRTANSIVNPIDRRSYTMVLPVLFGHTCSNPGMDFEGSSKSLESIQVFGQNNEGFDDRGKTRNQHSPCAKCSALTYRPPSTYGWSISRNSARSLTAESDRISIDFMSEIVNVVRNYSKHIK